jgi:hypothetical protein
VRGCFDIIPKGKTFSLRISLLQFCSLENKWIKIFHIFKNTKNIKLLKFLDKPAKLSQYRSNLYMQKTNGIMLFYFTMPPKIVAHFRFYVRVRSLETDRVCLLGTDEFLFFLSVFTLISGAVSLLNWIHQRTERKG